MTTPTRRHILARLPTALALAPLAPTLLAQTPQPSPPPAPDPARTSLHQEIPLKDAPPRIYAILLSSKDFADFSGLSADIDPTPGGAFTLFAGQVLGRLVELVPRRRIVQAWRSSHWDPGIFSIARFEFRPTPTGTTLILHHTGFPPADFDSLDSGWHSRYWDPLAKFLA